MVSFFNYLPVLLNLPDPIAREEYVFLQWTQTMEGAVVLNSVCTAIAQLGDEGGKGELK